MLTTGKDWLHKKVNRKIQTLLFGQELNPETYAICKADMLITDEDPENIRIGNSLSKDQFKDEYFLRSLRISSDLDINLIVYLKHHLEYPPKKHQNHWNHILIMFFSLH